MKCIPDVDELKKALQAIEEEQHHSEFYDQDTEAYISFDMVGELLNSLAVEVPSGAIVQVIVINEYEHDFEQVRK